MSLPILQVRQQPTREDLVRFYYRTELHWSRQLATEEVTLDAGIALFNPDLPEVSDANMMFDAALPGVDVDAAAADTTSANGPSTAAAPADRAIAEADEFFRTRGGRCRMWVINPSAPPVSTRPLEDRLLQTGFTRYGHDILHLASAPLGSIEEIGGLTIIPARASFRHARELSVEAAKEWGHPQLGDALMLHLEDPQTDARIAIKDGKAIALATVLAVGDIGCIENLFVVEQFRGMGVGRTLMSRAMEICARSLFKHVFIGVNPANAPAVSLYSRLGFQKIGEFASYRAV